jgi:hypothetical protein
VPAGPVTISWDRDVSLPPGDYTALLTVVDALGSSQASVPFTLG